MKKQILYKNILVNQGHDLVEVIVLSDGLHLPEVNLVFSGSNYATITVCLQPDEAVREIGNALIAAADLIGE